MSLHSNKTFSITKTVKRSPHIRGIPFRKVKDTVLGKQYDVSLVFIGSKLSLSLNKKYRKKDKSANVLSFPLSKSDGEIFITIDRVKKEYVRHGMTSKNYILYLFIHALLHLKGYKHGSKMNDEEKKILRRFSI